nr:effector binding domain-containing protein [Paenibacillus sp. FJAT-26967]
MNMTNNYTQLPAFELTGVHCRTTNEQEAGPEGKLGALWQQYFESGLSVAPGIRNPQFLYGLYTDYETDASGAYTALIGHELGAGEVREGLATAAVPAAKYKIFTTQRGPVQQVVAQKWQEIWQYFGQSSEERTYTGDFERYDLAKFDPAAAVVEIFVAVK